MKDFEQIIFNNVKSALADFLTTCEQSENKIPILHVSELIRTMGTSRLKFDRQTDAKKFIEANTARLNMAGIGIKPLSTGRYHVYRSHVAGEGSAVAVVEALQSRADYHLAKATAYIEALQKAEALLLSEGDQ